MMMMMMMIDGDNNIDNNNNNKSKPRVTGLCTPGNFWLPLTRGR